MNNEAYIDMFLELLYGKVKSEVDDCIEELESERS